MPIHELQHRSEALDTGGALDGRGAAEAIDQGTAEQPGTSHAAAIGEEASSPVQTFAVLLTNISLRNRTGTEVMTAELAFALARRGHRVAIYSPRLGAVAREVMAHGVPVTDRIEALGFTPDIIHGHHNTALAVAMVRFPASRAIFVCHDSAMTYDSPILDPRIGAYVGVDHACAERLLVEGAPASRIHVVPNAVDLRRFHCRTHWSDRPRTALAVTKARAPWLPAVREACARAGLTLTEVGPAVNNSVDDLPKRMAESDIVFAWSRSAAEAVTTGAAVILCDEFGFGGLLTAVEAERYPNNMLGRRVLRDGVTAEGVSRAIAAYDPEDAQRAAVVVRHKLSLDDMVRAYERIYDEVMQAPISEPAGTAGLAGFLERAMPRFDLSPELEEASQALAARLIRLDAWLGAQPDADPAAVAPRKVTFDACGLGVSMLGIGWAPSEDWGTWSDGTLATLDLPASLLAAWDGSIAIVCNHYFAIAEPPEVCRPVEVMVGRQLLARWHFLRSDYGLAITPRRLTVPDFLWRGITGTILLSFRMLAPLSPLAAGEGEDTRRLGLGLASMSPARERTMP